MICRRQLRQAEAEHAMQHGEFDPLLLASASKVAVIMSQDWCGQWAAMDRYLQELAAQPASAPLPGGKPEICVAVLLYNRVAYFQEFLRLKEGLWGNRLIPYVRYYRQGRLVAQSNYVSKEEFLSRLGV